ncbi:MAG: alpha-amylase [Erysipelotrichia bacterium]|jgi:glycosidase|nr:alpha-amylase [Erysipelotrichia bacterium]
MAVLTPKSLSHQTIYQVYPRNYSEAGTLKAVTQDLDRIKALGVDIVYLLPIHPIGVVARKGKLGSPYSIQDFRKVNPELGTKDDLKALIDRAHELGLKVMMDIVFNHTSRDNPWMKQYPDYYYYRDGQFANKVGDWSDICDLNYNYKPLWEEMIDILKGWALFGFDGFRCDVAPFVPLEFWLDARKVINTLNPHIIWFSESVHRSFLKVMRDEGFICHSDAEMYQAFDVLYDYDIIHDAEAYWEGKKPLSAFIGQLNLQEMIYPANYLKARSYENHDVPRLMKRTGSVAKTKNWVAAIMTLKGMGFLFNGIETLTDVLPDLFDKDPIPWSQLDSKWVSEITNLVELKKRPIFSTYQKYILEDTGLDIFHITYKKDDEVLISICNVGQIKDDVKVDLKDGEYANEFDGTLVRVSAGKVRLGTNPIIIHKM